MTYVSKTLLREVANDVASSFENSWPWEVFMCVSASTSHARRGKFGNHRFVDVLAKHDVATDGSLEFWDVLGSRLGSPPSIKGKNSTRLWFLLFLLESGLH